MNDIQFKYKPTGQWIVFDKGEWVLSDELKSNDEEGYIYEFINEIITTLECSYDDIEVLGGMTPEDASYLQSRIRQEGFDYTFESYSNFEDIKDKRFHELRLEYLESMKRLKDYIKSRM